MSLFSYSGNYLTDRGVMIPKKVGNLFQCIAVFDMGFGNEQVALVSGSIGNAREDPIKW